MTFDQFQEALKLLAEKKYPGDPKGYDKITTKLTASSSGPVTAGATVREAVCVCVCVCVRERERDRQTDRQKVCVCVCVCVCTLVYSVNVVYLTSF